MSVKRALLFVLLLPAALVAGVYLALTLVGMLSNLASLLGGLVIIAMAFGGWSVWRGRRRKGWGVFMSLLLAVLAAVLIWCAGQVILIGVDFACGGCFTASYEVMMEALRQ